MSKEHKKLLSEIKRQLKKDYKKSQEEKGAYITFQILSDNEDEMVVSFDGDKQKIKKNGAKHG